MPANPVPEDHAAKQLSADEEIVNDGTVFYRCQMVIHLCIDVYISIVYLYRYRYLYIYIYIYTSMSIYIYIYTFGALGFRG